MTAPNFQACSVARWVRSDPGETGRKAEIVLDPIAGAGLPTRGEALDDQRGEALRGRVDGGGQSGRPRPEHHDVECLLINLGAQAELVSDLRDRRGPQHAVGPDQDRALLGPDSQPVEQRPALFVRVDVAPVERDQIALEQLTDREGIARRASSDQQLIAEALPQQPLAPRDHGAQEQVAQICGTGDQRAQGIGRYGQDPALLGDDAAGDHRLAGEHGDVRCEGPGLALGEVVIAVRLAVDDVDRPGQDHEEGRIPLALLEEDLPRGEGQCLGMLRQLVDLGRIEVREQGRMVRIQKAFDWGR